MNERRAARSTALAGWLAAGICISVSTVGWFGFRATRQWEQSARLLIERRAEKAAMLLVTALKRDMRAAQVSVLSAWNWDEAGSDAADEFENLLAGAFVRYPYVDAFFTAGPDSDSSRYRIFVRSTRPPDWAPTPSQPLRYPVRVLSDTVVADMIRTGVHADVEHSRRLSAFEGMAHRVPYQVVARLQYRDESRQELVGIFGFVVNLPWVREHYFPELTRQVLRIGSADADVALAIVDGAGSTVVATRPISQREQTSKQRFQLMFLDPSFVPVNASLSTGMNDWTVVASGADDPALRAANWGATLTFLVAALATVTLAGGLVLTSRAVRTIADLADLRADFVSSVTHELKTPIANIRVIGDTLASGRIGPSATQREYAGLVVEEAKSLGRLVDNLLALARITDIADVYSFEPISVDELIAASIRGFSHQLTRASVRIESDIPDTVPAVLADRTAMRLVFDNLIANAIRYSPENHAIQIVARAAADAVLIDIHDHGCGIPPDELGRVTQKFFRGRNASGGGSGLGLSIVQRVLDNHHGAFSIRSTLGAGTTATITLPAVALVGD